MRLVDRGLLRNVDWVMLALILLVTLIGVTTIYSATRPVGGGEWPTFFLKQLSWLAIALGVTFVAVMIDYKWVERYAYKLYGVGLVLLIAVPIAGRVGMGAKRWITIGPVNIQPSELVRIFFLAALARHLSEQEGSLGPKEVFRAFMIFAAPPVLLILKQPDLGTAVVFLALFVVLILAKGLRRRFAILIVSILAVSIPFVGTVVWEGLKPYQKKRIMAFVNPEADPAGMSYHIQQSKVAIGSGQAAGKGYLKGTQGPFKFLPENHTDFIFAVFAEEWGFIGALVLISLYFTIFMRGLHTAVRAKDEFGQLLALGLIGALAIYTLINLAMTTGMAPVVGIPLPFMSYGGTALVMNYLAIGLLIGIRARRFELFY